MSKKKLVIGAVIYPGFEMLDMYGPLEMFSMLGSERIEILMLSETASPVTSAMLQNLDGGPKTMPDHTFQNAAAVDILLVPGGFGSRAQLENPAMLEFLQRQAETADYVCSVCTGSLLLARAGLLTSRRATTNKQFFFLTGMETAQVNWVEQARWVEDGKFFTSSGVSAGMDMSLALIAKLFGEDTAKAVAVGAEYSRHRQADEDPFFKHLNEPAHSLS